MRITATQPDKEECDYRGIPFGSWTLESDYPKHFPTDAITTVVDRRYFDGYKIGVMIGGSFGSCAVAVKDIEKAIELLKANGHEVVIKQYTPWHQKTA